MYTGDISRGSFYHNSRKVICHILYFTRSPLTQLLCFSEGTKLFFCKRLLMSSINLLSCGLTAELLGSRLSNSVLSFCTFWRSAWSSAGAILLLASCAFDAFHCLYASISP